MAGKLKMPNKKTTIIVGIIIAILAILAVTGTVVFLKDRGSTEAADLESEQVSSKTNGTSEQNEQQGAQSELTQNGEQTTSETQNQNEGMTQSGDNQTTPTTDEDTTGTTTSASTAGNAGTATTTDSIQETTITRIEEVQIPERQISEGHYVGWTSSNVKADLSYADKIDAKADDLQIVKIAETKTGENLVTAGEKITYKITVSSSKELSGIEVTDKIPEMTEYVLNSADNDGKAIDSNGNVVEDSKAVKGLKWNIDVTEWNEETQKFQKEVSFEVVVKSGVTGTIVNADAVANGKTTEEPTETAIITADKVATIEGKEEGQPAKVGDKVTYTIIITNTGDIEGIANVKDESLETLINDNILEISSESQDNANKLKEGTQINVPANGEAKISFTATVKNINGAIKNIATIGEEKPEETIDTVNIKGEKSNTAAETVKPGDEFDYIITLTNTGSVAGSATVTDEIPSQLEVISTNPTIENLEEQGNSLDFGTVTVEPGEANKKTITIHVKVKDTATGEIKNIAKVDGKDVEDKETIDTVNIKGEKSNTAAETVKPGDEFDYIITLTNTGSVAGSVTVTDEIPSQLEVISTNPAIENLEEQGNSLDFGTVTVEPGEANKKTITIHVKVKDTATGTFKNTAKVDEKDVPDREIEIENVTDITGVKANNDEDKKVKPGDTVIYTINLSNAGNVSGTTTVTDTLPAGVIYKSSSDNGENNNGIVIWKDIDVPVGTNTKQLTLTVEIDKTATGKIVNTAIVDNTKIEDEEGLDIIDITATKDSNIAEGTYAVVGQEVVYAIKATNNGTASGDAIITDELPSGLTFVEATLTNPGEDTVSEENGLVTWNVKELLTGEANARTLTIKATIDDIEGLESTIINEVKVDGNKTSDETIKVGKPEITSSKTSEIISCERNELTGTTVHENDQIRYKITVNNTGKVSKQISIIDQIKEGLSYVEGTLNAEFGGVAIENAKVENGVVKLENYTLKTGGTLTITFTTKVNALAEGQSEMTIDKNIAVVDGTNKEDDKGDYEVVKPIISAEKNSEIKSCSKNNSTQTAGKIVHENDQIKYTIKVSNTGKASGKVTIEDTIKEGLTYVQGTAKATIDNELVSGVMVSNGKLSLTDYTLEAGKIIVIEFTVSVDSLPKGVYSKVIDKNVATVNGDSIEDTKQYNVVKPNVVPSKTSEIIECALEQKTGTTVHEDDKIKYTIKIENSGTDSDVVTVTDTIPTGVTYVENSLSAKLNDNTNVEISINNNRQISLSAYTLAAGKTLTITFEATVNKLEEGIYNKTIEQNIAVVNGVNTPDNKGGYEVEKTQIEASKSVDKQEVEYNDILIYTITAKNLSTVAADVNINDPIPTGTEYVENSITVNGTPVLDSTNIKEENGIKKVVYTGRLAQQNDEVTITFQVKVTEKKIGAIIENKATINGEEKTATATVVKKVSVTTQSNKVNPIDLILVLDVSGSMNDNDKIDDLISSSKTLVNKVFASENGSTISIITYSDDAKTKGTYTYSQKQELLGAIDGLRANGGTNIYDALDEANNKVASLGNEREKVVVFLTDGSPTAPNSSRDGYKTGDYISGIYATGNNASGYTNNYKDKIVEKADSLKALAKVKKVYSIGLGVDDFNNTDVRYAEECTTEDIGNVISKDVVFNSEDHTFTVTLKNTSSEEITLTQVKMQASNLNSIDEASDNGQISRNTVKWNNVTIQGNETVTYTGKYTASRPWFSEEEYTPSANIEYDYSATCTTVGHTEQFNGKSLFSVVKTKDNKQYHCITEKDYANYLLSKISSDGASMNVGSVSVAFDKILTEISTSTETYTLREGNVLEISEQNTITSDVTVTIGENSETYTLEQLESGMNGLVYVEEDNFKGFRWTITEDSLLENKLSLSYEINE